MQSRRVRALALLTCLLSILVVLVSAYLRLSGAGLGCANWPDCYGRILTGLPHAPWEGARLAHRIVATLALLAGILLVWRCWRPQPLQPAARYATLLLMLMLFLSVVGVWSSDPRMALVNFINLIGGLGLVTFSWRVAITAEPSRLLERGTGGWLCRVAIAVMTLTVLLGGLIGARYAASACGTLPDCQGAWWPPLQGWSALHPFVTLAGPAGPGEADGVALHLLHRYAAALAGLLLFVVSLRLRTVPRARRAVLAVLTLLAGEILIGVLMVASGFSLWLGVAHNVGAALLLAATASLLHTLRK
ncbi:MAG: COX15/CtaA family protein [Betaproteobacteria bacterium]|jgi:heme A synthase|nr:COX15/CtaA family protein [Betaproteobacteria bacterium]